MQRVDEHSVALFREAMDQGIVAFDDPEALVTVFRMAFQGFLLNRAHGDRKLTQEQLTLTVKRLILELIKDE